MQLEEPDDASSAAFRRGVGLLPLRGLQYIGLFAANLISVRALGPAGRGQYALALACAWVVWAVLHLSVDDVGGRILARREASVRDVAHALSTAALLGGLVGFVIALLVELALRRTLLGGASVGVVWLAALTTPLLFVYQMAGGLVLRVGSARTYTLILAAAALVQAVVALALWISVGLTPGRAIIAPLASYGLAAVALAAAAARVTGWLGLRPRFNRTLLATLVRGAAGLHPGTLATYLNARLDLLLVGFLTTTQQAGLYSLATNLAETLVVATQTLGQAVMREQTVSSDQAAAAITVTFVRRSWMIVLGAAALACALAYPFVSLVYGPSWHRSVPPLVILAVAAVGMSVAGPFNVLMARLARLRDISFCAILAMLTNLGANLVLIPTAGIAGAALASLVSYWVYAGLLLRLFGRVTGTPVRRVFSPLMPNLR